MHGQIDSDQARRDQEEREKNPALPIIKSACRQKNERRHHDGAQNRRSDPANVKLIHKVNIIVGIRSRAGISFLGGDACFTLKRQTPRPTTVARRCRSGRDCPYMRLRNVDRAATPFPSSLIQGISDATIERFFQPRRVGAVA